MPRDEVWEEYQDAVGQLMADREVDEWADMVQQAEKRILKAVFDHEEQLSRFGVPVPEFFRFDIREALRCYRQVVPLPVVSDERWRPAPSNRTGD